MPKHTLGPWRVGDAGATVFGPPNGRPSPQTIADVRPVREYRENARLIAAAPELLAALQALVTAVEDPERDSLRQLLGAHAAISKAEGRS